MIDDDMHGRLDDTNQAIAALLDGMIANQQRIHGLLRQLVGRVRDRDRLLQHRSANGDTVRPGLADSDQLEQMIRLTRQWCVRELALLEDLLATTDPPV